MARWLMILVSFAQLAALGAEENWNSKPVLSFTVYFTEENAQEIEAVSKTIQDFHQSFIKATGADSGLFSDVRIDIYLYPAASKEVTVRYISLVGGPRQQGDKLGYFGKIKMPGPKAYDGRVISTNGHPMDRHSFDKFLVHEIAPAYLELYARSRGTQFNGQVPDWFEQGLEEYLAVFHSTPYWKTLGVKAYYDRLQKTPQSIDTDFGLNIRDRYNDGFILLNFLRDEFGEQTIFDVLVSREPTFGQKLHKTLSISFDDCLRRFNAWRENRIAKRS